MVTYIQVSVLDVPANYFAGLFLVQTLHPTVTLKGNPVHEIPNKHRASRLRQEWGPVRHYLPESNIVSVNDIGDVDPMELRPRRNIGVREATGDDIVGQRHGVHPRYGKCDVQCADAPGESAKVMQHEEVETPVNIFLEESVASLPERDNVLDTV